MNSKRLIGVALAGALALTAVGLAQDADAPRRRPPRPPGADAGMMLLERLTRLVSPSEEQLAQIKQVLDTHAQAIRNWQKEHGEEARALHEKMAEARKAGDKDEVEELAKQAQALRRSRAELTESLHKQVREVLTDEQKERARKAGLFGRPAAPRARPIELLRLLGRLDLTDEQKAQVKTIMDAARAEAAKAEGREAKVAALRAGHKKIVETVLTAEQRKKLAAFRDRGPDGPPRRPFADLDLTDEQKAQVKTIMDAARAKGKDAEPGQRREIRGEALKTIRDEVLTDAQRAKARQRRARRRPGPPGAGRPAPDAPPGE